MKGEVRTVALSWHTIESSVVDRFLHLNLHRVAENCDLKMFHHNPFLTRRCQAVRDSNFYLELLGNSHALFAIIPVHILERPMMYTLKKRSTACGQVERKNRVVSEISPQIL